MALSIDADRAEDVSRIAGEHLSPQGRAVIGGSDSGRCTIALAWTEAASIQEGAVQRNTRVALNRGSTPVLRWRLRDARVHKILAILFRAAAASDRRSVVPVAYFLIVLDTREERSAQSLRHASVDLKIEIWKKNF